MCILLSKYISLLHDFKQCVIICKEEKEDKRTINMTLGVSIINQNTHKCAISSWNELCFAVTPNWHENT